MTLLFLFTISSPLANLPIALTNMKRVPTTLANVPILMQPLYHYDPVLLPPVQRILVVRIASTQALIYQMLSRHAVNVAHGSLEVTSEATVPDMSGGDTQITLHT
jgi:hypothetical protein